MAESRRTGYLKLDMIERALNRNTYYVSTIAVRGVAIGANTCEPLMTHVEMLPSRVQHNKRAQHSLSSINGRDQYKMVFSVRGVGFKTPPQTGGSIKLTLVGHPVAQDEYGGFGIN